MEEKFDTVIKSKNGWFDINIKELFQYKDLIFLFVKRNYTTRYKQTILGPLWLILNPLLTVLLYAFVFGNIAGLSTDGSPQLAFYLASNALWSYFAACLSQTATTFTANSMIFGKVYFPRLTMPISTVLTAGIDLAIQVFMLIVILLFYMVTGTTIGTNISILLIPVLVVQIALLGLGCGIIISSLTTKYRDLAVLVAFGVQLWMYASPVVYSVSQIPERIYAIYMLNPVAPIITMWRYAFLGSGTMPLFHWGISWLVTLVILGVGIVLFSKIEKTFMDTV
ncbi:MAG: ABC transporter permease [Lachnospiraceae bacterium]|nr:ABC transporter permease [Lachnospiraceae bacterium]